MALSNADDLFVDGTFEFVDKTLFSQLWVVVVRISMFVRCTCVQTSFGVFENTRSSKSKTDPP